MSAAVNVLHELRAIHAAIGGAIDALARLVDVAPTLGANFTTSVKSGSAAPAATAKPAALKPAQPTLDGSAQTRVLMAMRGIRKPASCKLIAEKAGIDQHAASIALKKMRDAGSVQLTGRSHTAVWSIVTATAPVTEVVWSASKERQGTAPSLSSVGRAS